MFTIDDGFQGRFARYGLKETAYLFVPDLSQTVKTNEFYEALMRDGPKAGLLPERLCLISSMISPPRGELLRCNKKEQ